MRYAFKFKSDLALGHTQGPFLRSVHVHLCSSLSLSSPTPQAGAGRHLPQAGQVVEDALRHTRELVAGQNKGPVGMPDMSRRIQLVTLSVPTVPPWIGDIAIDTICTRTRLKSLLVFIIVFIHFCLIQFSRYQSFEHLDICIVRVPKFGTIMW